MMPEPLPGYDRWKLATPFGDSADDPDCDGVCNGCPKAYMGCSTVRIRDDGDRADEAHDTEGDR